ncbi:hypothetical protein EI94DRAFT_1700576 [Lactarius quietus]|nr:hypothetical protein EI94DRAFT_1700576 [Lactarius quietus]
MPIPFSSQKSSPASSPPPYAPPLRSLVSGLLALYALYTIYNLVLARPPNLFTSLQLSLNAPQAVIHAALLRNTSSSDDALPSALEKLLARLASPDARMMLVRFGQRAMQTCAHCTTQADYALHALPPALLSYTLAAVVLGVTTARGTARESRRAVGLIALVVGALAEAYWAYTVPISIPRRSAPRSNPDEIIMHTAHAADELLARTHLLRLGSAGVQRVPELRERAAVFWTREQGVGEAVRQDAGVRAAAERAGFGLSAGVGDDGMSAPSEDGSQGEGALHKAAREAVKALKEAGSRPPL